MHLTKLFVIGLLIVHTLFSESNSVLWLAISLPLIALLFYVSALNIKQFLFRNIPIFSFAVFFSLFILFSAWLNDSPRDLNLLFMTPVKIILMFNIVLTGTAWLGREGLLFIVKNIPFQRLKLFLILLSRSINGLRRNSAGIANQIRSRLDLSGRDKLLIPRFYVRNLIMKDLYAFQHNQAALVSRLDGEEKLRVWPVSIVKTKDIAAAVLAVSLILAGIVLSRIQ